VLLFWEKNELDIGNSNNSINMAHNKDVQKYVCAELLGIYLQIIERHNIITHILTMIIDEAIGRKYEI